MGKISTMDYYNYKASIKSANAAKDADGLVLIKSDLIDKYGLHDEDVQELLGEFDA